MLGCAGLMDSTWRTGKISSVMEGLLEQQGLTWRDVEVEYVMLCFTSADLYLKRQRNGALL